MCSDFEIFVILDILLQTLRRSTAAEAVPAEENKERGRAWQCIAVWNVLRRQKWSGELWIISMCATAGNLLGMHSETYTTERTQTCGDTVVRGCCCHSLPSTVAESEPHPEFLVYACA